MASSVSPSSSASQGSGASELSMLEPPMCVSVVELRESGVEGGQVAEILRMYYSVYAGYLRSCTGDVEFVSAPGGVGTSVPSGEVDRGSMASPGVAKRSRRKRRGSRGSMTSTASSRYSNYPDGRCYMKLVRVEKRSAVKLGSFPTFDDVLSSSADLWDFDRIGATFIRRVRGEVGCVYHVASHGISCVDTLSNVAANKQWAPLTLGAELLSAAKSANRTLSACVVRLGDQLGGDRSLPWPKARQSSRGAVSSPSRPEVAPPVVVGASEALPQSVDTSVGGFVDGEVGSSVVTASVSGVERAVVVGDSSSSGRVDSLSLSDLPAVEGEVARVTSALDRVSGDLAALDCVTRKLVQAFDDLVVNLDTFPDEVSSALIKLLGTFAPKVRDYWCMPGDDEVAVEDIMLLADREGCASINVVERFKDSELVSLATTDLGSSLGRRFRTVIPSYKRYKNGILVLPSSEKSVYSDTETIVGPALISLSVGQQYVFDLGSTDVVGHWFSVLYWTEPSSPSQLSVD